MKQKSMRTIAVAATLVVLGMSGAFAQSTVVNAENEPAPSLTVQPPLPGPLAQGVVFLPYRMENLRIVPVGGAAARDISPRFGHRHITLDDLPWQWADYGGSNTIVLVGLPRGVLSLSKSSETACQSNLKGIVHEPQEQPEGRNGDGSARCPGHRRLRPGQV